jgi:hypothetical protein
MGRINRLDEILALIKSSITEMEILKNEMVALIESSAPESEKRERFTAFSKEQSVKCKVNEDAIRDFDVEMKTQNFYLVIDEGKRDSLQISSADCGTLDRWSNSVRNKNERDIINDADSILKIIERLALGESSFKERKKPRGRAMNHESNFNMWAYSECYNVAAAAAEFNKSESAVKKARSFVSRYPAYKKPSEKTRKMAEETVKWFECKKRKADMDKRVIPINEMSLGSDHHRRRLLK